MVLSIAHTHTRTSTWTLHPPLHIQHAQTHRYIFACTHTLQTHTPKFHTQVCRHFTVWYFLKLCTRFHEFNCDCWFLGISAHINYSLWTNTDFTGLISDFCHRCARDFSKCQTPRHTCSIHKHMPQFYIFVIVTESVAQIVETFTSGRIL